MAFALVGAHIFDGERMLDGHAVVVEQGLIARILPASELPSGLEVRQVEGLLAPGFIDIQVNGGGGVLFNDFRTVEGIRAIGAAHRRFGTTGFLPTFITDTRERMAEAVEAAGAALDAGVPGVLGIHVEGPFINPERKGVHNPAYMRPLEDEDFAILTGLNSGRTLVTLAPEMVPMATIAGLAKAGVTLAAGHTRADYDTVMEARQNGLTGFTHLYNAMPPLMSREPGPVGAALDDPDSFVSLIVDLHNVSAPALRVAIAAKGAEQTILVTDAMSTVGSDIQSFELHGRRILRAGGRLTTADGTLAGSDLDMASAVRNTVRELRVPLENALNMASLNPAKFLRLDGELGRIAPGYRASLLLLDKGLEVRATWTDGEEEAVKSEPMR